MIALVLGLAAVLAAALLWCALYLLTRLLASAWLRLTGRG